MNNDWDKERMEKSEGFEDFDPDLIIAIFCGGGIVAMLVLLILGVL